MSLPHTFRYLLTCLIRKVGSKINSFGTKRKKCTEVTVAVDMRKGMGVAPLEKPLQERGSRRERGGGEQGVKHLPAAPKA